MQEFGEKNVLAKNLKDLNMRNISSQESTQFG